jgi:hypothetical protein
MKRFRLSTLTLLIVIAALGIALVVQQRRAARREAEQRARAAHREAELQNRMWMQETKHMIILIEKDADLEAARGHADVEAKGVEKSE